LSLCNVYGILESVTPMIMPICQTVIGHEFHIKCDKIEVIQGMDNSYEII